MVDSCTLVRSVEPKRALGDQRKEAAPKGPKLRAPVPKEPLLYPANQHAIQRLTLSIAPYSLGSTLKLVPRPPRNHRVQPKPVTKHGTINRLIGGRED